MCIRNVWLFWAGCLWASRACRELLLSLRLVNTSLEKASLIGYLIKGRFFKGLNTWLGMRWQRCWWWSSGWLWWACTRLLNVAIASTMTTSAATATGCGNLIWLATAALCFFCLSLRTPCYNVSSLKALFYNFYLVQFERNYRLKIKKLKIELNWRYTKQQKQQLRW